MSKELSKKAPDQEPEKHPSEGDKSVSEEDLFSMFPEGTRIFIEGNSVTFENLPEELLDVVHALNPDDSRFKKGPKS